MTKKKADTLGEKLDAAVNDMLDTVKGKDIDAELKLKVFNSAAKYWAIKQRVADAGLGAGFRDEEEEE